MHPEQLKQRSENLRKANAKLTPEQNGILEKIASVLNSFNPDDCPGDLVEEIYCIMDQHCPEMMN